jgi:cytochrome b
MGYEPKAGPKRFSATGDPRLPAWTGYRPPHVTVWDIGVRLFHWLLAIAVLAALLSGYFAPKRWLDLHIVVGTAIAALVAFRVIWGFLGSTHARFAGFVVGPRAVLAHVRALLDGRAGRHVGHNPLGATMILALLAALALLTLTGLVALGGELKQGPLAFFTRFTVGHDAREIHEWLAAGLIGLVSLHLAGVAIESLRTRENLVRAMVSGTKAADAHAPATMARSRPRAALMLSIAIAILAGIPIARLSAWPALGMPAAPLDPVYANECGDCHTAFHPSLAPAATWQAVMRGLDHHFGENASLDPAVAARLAAYLAANSAEHWDSKPSHLLRNTNPADPLRITATTAWQRIHGHLPPRVFARKAVGSQANCAACHGDAASGRFAPQQIAIPKETTTP